MSTLEATQRLGTLKINREAAVDALQGMHPEFVKVDEVDASSEDDLQVSIGVTEVVLLHIATQTYWLTSMRHPLDTQKTPWSCLPAKVEFLQVQPVRVIRTEYRVVV